MPESDSQGDVILDTLAYTLVDRLLVHCKHSMLLSDADWDCWIAQCCRPDHDAVLVTGSNDAAVPSSKQRVRLMNAMDAAGRRHVPVAVVVPSSLHRGVFTVFQWLAGERARVLRAFPPQALDEVLAWLGVDVHRAHVENAIARLQSALARPLKTARAR